jgi:hypothetical protein
VDALIIAGFILAVLAVVLCLVLAGVVSYVLYAFVYTPWKVMRQDLVALAQWRQSVEDRLVSSGQSALDDVEIARREARLAARARTHGLRAP